MQPISSLMRALATATNNAPVRVQGAVLDQRLGEYIVIHDDSGTLFAETRQAAVAKVKERVDLWGEPARDGSRVYLKNATFHSAGSGVPPAKEIAAAAVKPAQLPLLTKAWEVRDLPAERAAWQYPVRLRGVVTVHTGRDTTFFAQDDTSGIYIRMKKDRPELKPGDLVEIEGVSDPGGFAPIVAASNVTVVGTAPLPEPRQVTLFQLATGQEGSQWIEVRGVVRSLSFTNGVAQLELSDPSGTLAVYIPAATEPTNLLDAVVRIRGACASESNTQRQLTRLQMWASSLDYVQMEEPGVADPFSLPVRPIVSLSRYRPRASLQRRVNLAGVVTLCQPGQSFFLQDASDGIQVFTAQAGDVKPGDRVMAAGYPAFGDYGSVLRAAVVRVLEHGPVPAPKPLAPAYTLDPQLHDRWVQIDARLLNRNTVGRTQVLTLQLPDRVFEAHCLAPELRAKAPLAGSLLRLTGVYRVLADEARSPVSFQLLVPARENVRVLNQPSWWTFRRTVTAVGIMAVVIAATLLWIFLLDRQVRRQTRCLRERLEREAALEQRYREIFESANDMIFTHDLEGRLTSFNPAALHVLGYSADEAKQLTIDQVLAPEYHDHGRQLRETTLPAGEVVNCQGAFLTKDGRRVMIEVSLRMAFRDGKPAAVHGIARDITERKRIEERYRTIIGAALDGFWLTDMQGRFLDVNDAYCNLIGYGREELLSMSIPDIEAAEKPEETAARIRKIMEVGGDRFETHHRCKDGRLVDVEVSVNYLKEEERMSVFLRDITERKRAEAALCESQALYHSLVEHLPGDINVYRKDREDRFIYVNSRFCQFQGRTADQILGKTLFDLIPKDLAEQFTREDQMIVRTGKAIEHEEERQDLGEKVRYLHVVKSPVFNSEGAIIGIQGTFYDITERKRAEAALAEASSLLETLLEHSPDVIYFKDRQSHFVRFSKSFGRLFNVRDPAVLKGKTDFDFFTEEHARQAFEDEQEIIRTGKPMAGKLEKETHPGGRVTWALTNKMPWRDKDGNVIGTFGISKDATELKETQDKLGYERELLRALLDNVPDCIYFKDRQSRFVRVSKAKALKAIQRAPQLESRLAQGGGPAGNPSPSAEAEVLTGLTDFDIFTEEHARPAFEDEQEIMRTGKPIIGKPEKETHLDGSVTWTLSTKMPWHDQEGNIIGNFGVSRDITALKQAEAELEATHNRLVDASRLAGMAEVATDVLHNVGNVLTSVNVSCSLVIDRMQQYDFANVGKIPLLLQENAGRLDEFLTTDPKGKHIPEYLTVLAQTFVDHKTFLQDELNRLRQHIDHIKQIVSVQQSYAKVAGVEEMVDVAQLVEDALHINAAALDRHTVHVRREMEPVPPVLADKHKVLQILVNLIRNAKYALSDTDRQDKLLTVRVDGNAGHHVQIHVIDNGVGIAPANLTRIFAHGFTTRGDGHGFGLHSGALAAHDLGGSLSAHSDGLGKGATFTLLLPLRPPQRT